MRKVSTKKYVIKKNPMEMIELKNTIAEIKNKLMGGIVKRTEVRISELEERLIEFTQYEQ